MKTQKSLKAVLWAAFVLLGLGLSKAEAFTCTSTYQSSGWCGPACPTGEDACSGIVDDTLRQCCREGLSFYECAVQHRKSGTYYCGSGLASNWDTTTPVISPYSTLDLCCVGDVDTPGNRQISSCFSADACQMTPLPPAPPSPPPSFMITKTADQTDVALSEGVSQPEVSFKITVLNTGISVAKGVVIKDILPTAYDAPKGFELVSFDCGYGGVPSRTIDAAATCSYEAIGSAETRSVRVTMKIHPDTKCDSLLTNKATVALKSSASNVLGTAKADVHVTCPAPAPAPEPQPEPTPEPAPQPQPEPAPAPTPEPQPAPAPAPTPAPQPKPAPTPLPVPAAPAPAPQPVVPEVQPSSDRFKAICTSAPENMVKVGGQDYIFAIAHHGGPVEATIELVPDGDASQDSAIRYLSQASSIQLTQVSGTPWSIVGDEAAGLVMSSADFDGKFTVIPNIPNEPEEARFKLTVGPDSYEVSCLTIVGIQGGGGCALAPEKMDGFGPSSSTALLLVLSVATLGFIRGPRIPCDIGETLEFEAEGDDVCVADG